MVVKMFFQYANYLIECYGTDDELKAYQIYKPTLNNPDSPYINNVKAIVYNVLKRNLRLSDQDAVDAVFVDEDLESIVLPLINSRLEMVVQ